MVLTEFKRVGLGACAGLLALLSAGQVVAGEADLSDTSLGTLTERADRIAVVLVTEVRQREVVAAVVTDLKWCRRKAVVIPRREVVSWRVGQQSLVFLDLDARGRLETVRHRRQVVVLDDDAAVAEFTAAVRSRLDSVTQGAAERRAAIFSQLSSRQARIRDDAALDLVRSGEAVMISSYERSILVASLRLHPTAQILRLVGAVGHSELLAPLLALAHEVDAPGLGDAICSALTQVDLKAAETALAQDLGRGDSERSVQAARLLGKLGGRRAGSLLAEALEDSRPQVQLAAIVGLGDCGAAGDHADALEGLVWTLKDSRSVQSALAALALDGALDSLKRIARDHPQRDVRRLAAKLRRDRGTMARDLLHP